jgi:hypothetical protein
LCHTKGHQAHDCREKDAVSKKSAKPPQKAAAVVSTKKVEENQSEADEASSANPVQKAAGCSALDHLKLDIKDGQPKLASGRAIPILIGACEEQPRTRCKNMPVSEGYVRSQKVQVLRDTGCSSAAVKSIQLGDSRPTNWENIQLLAH